MESVNQKGFDLMICLLQYSSEKEREEKVKQLIMNGVDVFCKDSIGNTALHYTATCTDNINIVNAIILNVPSDSLKKKLICAENDFKQTALSLAVEHKRINIAKNLIQRYTEFDISCNNISLIYLSAQNNDFGMLYTLIEVCKFIRLVKKKPFKENI